MDSGEPRRTLSESAKAGQNAEGNIEATSMGRIARRSFRWPLGKIRENPKSYNAR